MTMFIDQGFDSFSKGKTHKAKFTVPDMIGPSQKETI